MNASDQQAPFSYSGARFVSESELAIIDFIPRRLQATNNESIQSHINMAVHDAEMQPSALTTLINDKTPKDAIHPEYLHELALHILHTLQYQHHWTNLRIYTQSPVTNLPLQRPLVLGLPPKRLYIHPDEQVELLAAFAARAKQAQKTKIESPADADFDQGEDDEEKFGQPEEEWVLPTHLREKWSLKMFSEVFDGISMTPPGTGQSENKWRKDKRMLMATAQDDSTIVFYIVHDGIVKPRQN
jgi:tRNA-splicing endonuclease subunit Sen15